MSGESDGKFRANTGQGGPPPFGGRNSVNTKGNTGVSYRDKLLSLGESGYLEKNGVEDEAIQGWRNYFTKMSEEGSRQSQGSAEEGGDMESTDKEAWMETGDLPKLEVSADDYASWFKPYMNSLLVKLLGKTMAVNFMIQRMERMWGAKRPMRVTPLSNGYFLVSFSTPEDRDYALQEGPWMIADHYLLVQRWRPNFQPWKADHTKRIAAWVRVLDLPAELYNVESLRRIGNLV